MSRQVVPEFHYSLREEVRSYYEPRLFLGDFTRMSSQLGVQISLEEDIWMDLFFMRYKFVSFYLISSQSALLEPWYT